MSFAPFNLVNGDVTSLGSLNLILLRNVLIYFALATKKVVVNRLLDRLRPDGHLVVGHADSLNHVTDRVRPLAPSIYGFPPGGANE